MSKHHIDIRAFFFPFEPRRRMIRFVFVFRRRGRKYDVRVGEVGPGGHGVAAFLVPE